MLFLEVEPRTSGAGLISLARAAAVVGSRACRAQHDALEGTFSLCAFLCLLLVASVKGTLHLLCLQS